MTRWMAWALAAVSAVGAVLFWPAVWGFLASLAQAVWLLLRLSILRVDQGTLWALGLLAAVLVLVVRLALGMEEEETPLPRRDRLPREVERWRGLMGLGAADGRFERTLQRELVWSYVLAYTLRHRIPPGFEISEAFRKKGIPLPDSVYGLLFAPLPTKRRFPASLLAFRFPSGPAARRAALVRNLDLILSTLEHTMEAPDVRN